MFKLNDEDKLLLELLIGSTSRQASRMSAINDTGWSAVLERSMRTGSAPFLYKRLRDADVHAVPDFVMSSLRNQYRITATRNTLLEQELIKVLKILSSVGVEAVVLKGIHIARNFYGDIGARPMGDIDLLVRHGDLEKVTTALPEIGFRKGTYNSPKVEEKFNLNFELEHETHTVHLEVHWMLTPPRCGFNVDLEAVWNSAVSGREIGLDCLVLSPEHLLIYLCMHIARHGEFSLKNCSDIALIAQGYKGGLDWDLIYTNAREWRLTKCLAVALLTTDNLFNLNLPAQLTDSSSAPERLKQAVEYALMQIFERYEYDPAVSTGLTRLSVETGFLKKIKLFVSIVFPGRELLQGKYVSLHGENSYLRNIFRHWSDLTNRHNSAVLKLIVGDRQTRLKFRTLRSFAEFMQADNGPDL